MDAVVEKANMDEFLAFVKILEGGDWAVESEVERLFNELLRLSESEGREQEKVVTEFKEAKTLIFATYSEIDKIQMNVESKAYGSEISLPNSAVEAVKRREKLLNYLINMQFSGLVLRFEEKMEQAYRSSAREKEMCLSSALKMINILDLSQQYGLWGYKGEFLERYPPRILCTCAQELAKAKRLSLPAGSFMNTNRCVLLNDEDITSLKQPIPIIVNDTEKCDKSIASVLNVKLNGSDTKSSQSSSAPEGSDAQAEKITALKLELENAKSKLAFAQTKTSHLQGHLVALQQEFDAKTVVHSNMEDEKRTLYKENIELEICAEFCAEVVAGWFEGGKERFLDGRLKSLSSRGRPDHRVISQRNSRVHGGNLRLAKALFDHGLLKTDKDRREFRFRFGCNPTDNIINHKEIEIRELKAAGVNVFIGTELSYLRNKASNQRWNEIFVEFEALQEDSRSDIQGRKKSQSEQAKLFDDDPVVEKLLIELRGIYNETLKDFKSQTRVAARS
ncbi:hypothetical protein VTL71DRAFT_8646 [Oculimacula yallundae]|uniref:Uncharacterized protein n=1 Tax=Oculimacula yallundae TaxID=86028 RepID=A0ABR4CZ66_9HELO